MEVNKIFNSRGMDGLSRYDRERMASYNRKEYLYDKFLASRKKEQNLQLTHEHILDLGEKSLKKFELHIREDASSELQRLLKIEVERLEVEVAQYKEEIKKEFEQQFENEKILMKNDYDNLMSRIEKQRDEAEEERMKELIRKMNEDCEIALKRQWQDAEELKKRTLEEMEKLLRKQIWDEMLVIKEKAVRKALEEAEEEFKIREKQAIDKTRMQCEKEANEQIRQLCERYDASIEKLLQKLKETEEKLKRETELRIRFEDDFRLLQADYKRFMNYTDHYNSDYMMKLRHIGTEILQDTEFEYKLDSKIKTLDIPKKPNNRTLKKIEHVDSTTKSNASFNYKK